MYIHYSYGLHELQEHQNNNFRPRIVKKYTVSNLSIHFQVSFDENALQRSHLQCHQCLYYILILNQVLVYCGGYINLSLVAKTTFDLPSLSLFGDDGPSKVSV